MEGNSISVEDVQRIMDDLREAGPTAYNVAHCHPALAMELRSMAGVKQPVMELPRGQGLNGYVMGCRLYENPCLTESEIVARTWRERLWSWPWAPWRATKVIKVPSRSVYLTTGGMA